MKNKTPVPPRPKTEAETMLDILRRKSERFGLVTRTAEYDLHDLCAPIPVAIEAFNLIDRANAPRTPSPSVLRDVFNPATSVLFRELDFLVWRYQRPPIGRLPPDWFHETLDELRFILGHLLHFPSDFGLRAQADRAALALTNLIDSLHALTPHDYYHDFVRNHYYSLPESELTLKDREKLIDSEDRYKPNHRPLLHPIFAHGPAYKPNPQTTHSPLTSLTRLRAAFVEISEGLAKLADKSPRLREGGCTYRDFMRLRNPQPPSPQDKASTRRPPSRHPVTMSAELARKMDSIRAEFGMKLDALTQKFDEHQHFAQNAERRNARARKAQQIHIANVDNDTPIRRYRKPKSTQTILDYGLGLLITKKYKVVNQASVQAVKWGIEKKHLPKMPITSKLYKRTVASFNTRIGRLWKQHKIQEAMPNPFEH